MIEAFALPRFRSRLAALRRRPPPPDFFACRLIERRDKPANALVSAGRAGDDEVADGERSARGVVVLMPVGHLGFPQQRTGVFVQRDEVRVVGDHEQAIAGDGGAAIDTAGRVAHETFCPRALVMPDLAA